MRYALPQLKTLQNLNILDQQKMPSRGYRLFVVIHYATQAGFLAHLVFTALFAWFGVDELVVFGLANAAVFLGCYVLNQRGYPHHALGLTIFSVVVHSYLAVLYIGWQSSFHYYILALAPMIFYSPSWPRRVKFLLVGILCALYLNLFMAPLSHLPLIPLTPEQMRILSFINIPIIFFTLSALVYLYNLAASMAENQLRQANRQLEQLAKTDPLTHLLNRRDILNSIDLEVERFEDLGQIFTLIVADIDHFKLFNDQYGHDYGDYVLVRVARLLKKLLRQQDLVARWGGEEFLILLPGTCLEEGAQTAERLKTRIASLPLNFQGRRASVTMTFGVASFGNSMSIEECIRSADQAMYEGKRLGRNCIICSRPTPTLGASKVSAG